jgi:NACHT domain
MLINIDEVVTGALVNAIALAGRRISVAVDGLRGRRRVGDLTAARWFETYRMTSEAPGLPELPAELTERLAEIMRGDEAQAALHELLAARLTDAPETDATAARQVLSLTLTSADAGAAGFAEALADYYDDQARALVARLEADDPPLLAQIRSEAFSTRLINILNAIERHTAALSARPNQRTESRFLASYRRHVVDQHGKLEPPDFDRRRRVPIADVYVPTRISEELPQERVTASRSGRQASLDVYELTGRLDRSVLLGDPGGGKTTAANVLMHHFASESAGRVPFLVTLRDYAAHDPPERSVLGHIEHTLEIFYQCPAPPGLADLLLLTGRAVVVFDGLDELLDTSRRADVTTRVERFCAEYPLAPVLITSRLVGYDQARLDDSQFTCYRLGKLADEQVGEFARKWFTQDDQIGPGDADSWTETFLAESGAASDLRSNPLMLSLLCILYRGEGSLPRDRAEVYEQCAMLMFRRWDARRRIRQDLRAGHLLEPALRHLAWWLFTRDDAQSEVTERELVTATTGFLQDRGFESQEAAAHAAREFVSFSRGRMWVFSDAGTTASGERLYAFTHRTFLEYFAAAQLAYDSDTPEQLAATIVPHVGREQWRVVAELAVQIKDRTSNGGAQRIYDVILDDRDLPAKQRGRILEFLAQCLRSVDPSPPRVRALTRRIFDETCALDQIMNAGAAPADLEEPDAPFALPLIWSAACHGLLIHCGDYRDTVADEIDATVADDVRRGDHDRTVSSLRTAASFPHAFASAPWTSDAVDRGFWIRRADGILRRHAAAMAAAAETDVFIRTAALRVDIITRRQALDMPGGPSVFFQPSEGCFTNFQAYFVDLICALDEGWPAFGEPGLVEELTAFGDYLISNPGPPWIHGDASRWDDGLDALDEPSFFTGRPGPLNQMAYLGAAAMLSILEETNPGRTNAKRRLGPMHHMAPYLAHRQGLGLRTKLPSLLVPEDFKQTFRDWAEGRVDFMATDGEPDQACGG